MSINEDIANPKEDELAQPDTQETPGTLSTDRPVYHRLLMMLLQQQVMNYFNNTTYYQLLEILQLMKYMVFPSIGLNGLNVSKVGQW